MRRQTTNQNMLSHSYFKVFLAIIILIIALFYFKFFFTKGIYYDDVFLKKKEVTSHHYQYVGQSLHGDLSIAITGDKNTDMSSEVTYRLPNHIDRRYTVYYINKHDWDAGINKIIDEKDEVIFEGEYRKDVGIVFGTDGKPIFNSEIVYLQSGESRYTRSYTITPHNIASIATFNKDTIRGNPVFLLIAIVLFLYVLVDYHFPRFFFFLDHFISVKNPEPSDFYLSLQKASWYVAPIVGVGFLIAAIIPF